MNRIVNSAGRNGSDVVPARAVAPEFSAAEVVAAEYVVPGASRVAMWRSARNAYRVNPDGSVSFADRFSAYDVS